MKTIYETPAKLWCRIRRQENDIKIAERALNESYKVHHALLDALEESYERVRKGLPVGITIDPVCEKCDDTHRMTWQDSDDVPCTFCPTPCQKCRKDGIGPYCTDAPCSCVCHKKGT